MNDIIFSYTRAQALEDGVLVDVSELAREAGFRYPVALTRGAWCQCVEVTEKDVCQDQTGRLWDILSVLKYRIRASKDEQVVYFEVLVAKGGKQAKPYRLKSHCGPGDNAEPVITVMLPDED